VWNEGDEAGLGVVGVDSEDGASGIKVTSGHYLYFEAATRVD
jgi:hypothetical protein